MLIGIEIMFNNELYQLQIMYVLMSSHPDVT